MEGQEHAAENRFHAAVMGSGKDLEHKGQFEAQVFTPDIMKSQKIITDEKYDLYLSLMDESNPHRWDGMDRARIAKLKHMLKTDYTRRLCSSPDGSQPKYALFRMSNSKAEQGTSIALRVCPPRDWFDTIDQIHRVKLGHSGINKVHQVIHSKYANIPKNVVVAFIKACPCSKKKRDGTVDELGAPGEGNDQIVRSKRRRVLNESGEYIDSDLIPSDLPVSSGGGHLRVYALRLRAGQELKSTILNFIRKNRLKAAFIQTCVGNLKTLTMKTASAMGALEPTPDNTVVINTPLEIVSLTGTMGPGETHNMHISVADGEGRVFGGGIIEGLVQSTVEIVLGEIENLVFLRHLDKETGQNELQVHKVQELLWDD